MNIESIIIAHNDGMLVPYFHQFLDEWVLVLLGIKEQTGTLEYIPEMYSYFNTLISRGAKFLLSSIVINNYDDNREMLLSKEHYSILDASSVVFDELTIRGIYYVSQHIPQLIESMDIAIDAEMLYADIDQFYDNETPVLYFDELVRRDIPFDVIDMTASDLLNGILRTLNECSTNYVFADLIPDIHDMDQYVDILANGHRFKCTIELTQHEILTYIIANIGKRSNISNVLDQFSDVTLNYMYVLGIVGTRPIKVDYPLHYILDDYRDYIDINALIRRIGESPNTYVITYKNFSRYIDGDSIRILERMGQLPNIVDSFSTYVQILEYSESFHPIYRTYISISGDVIRLLKYKRGLTRALDPNILSHHMFYMKYVRQHFTIEAFE